MDSELSSWAEKALDFVTKDKRQENAFEKWVSFNELRLVLYKFVILMIPGWCAAHCRPSGSIWSGVWGLRTRWTTSGATSSSRRPTGWGTVTRQWPVPAATTPWTAAASSRRGMNSLPNTGPRRSSSTKLGRGSLSCVYDLIYLVAYWWILMLYNITLTSLPKNIFGVKLVAQGDCQLMLYYWKGEK